MRSAWLKVRGERGEEMWMLKEGLKRQQLMFLKHRPSVAELAQDSWNNSLPPDNGRPLHTTISEAIVEGMSR